MILSGTKSMKVYQTLCSVLKRNDIAYECDEENLCVKCSISGKVKDFRMIFVIEPSKMLISLYVPIEINSGLRNVSELAFALCVINDTLSDGHFCFDRKNIGVYFKMTSSFYNSLLSESIFEYMLSVAAEKTDEYYLKINELVSLWK